MDSTLPSCCIDIWNRFYMSMKWCMSQCLNISFKSRSSNARVAKAYYNWRMTMRWYTMNHAIWFYISAKTRTSIMSIWIWNDMWHVTVTYDSYDLCVQITKYITITSSRRSLTIIDNEHKSPCKTKHVWEIKGSYELRMFRYKLMYYEVSI